MAETSGVQTSGVNELVGKVFILYGKVKAISPDGTVRILTVNSPVFAFDRIVTEDDGSVSLILEGPPPVQLDIGRMSDIVLDEDVYQPITSDEVADATAEVEEIQQALLEGEGDIELEPPAAGGEADSGGGHPTVVFEPTGDEVIPESGAETIGLGPGETIEPLEGPADSPEEPIDSFPSISEPTDGSVNETGGLESFTGDLAFDYGADGPGSIELSTDGATWNPDTLTLTADDGTWQVVVDEADQTYTFTQLTPVDHPDPTDPNDVVNIPFTVTVTDADGDSVSEDFTVAVYDDGPVAVDDASGVQSGATLTITEADGLLSNDTLGADGAVVTAVDATGTQGSLTWNADGSYTYTAIANATYTDVYTLSLIHI